MSRSSVTLVCVRHSCDGQCAMLLDSEEGAACRQFSDTKQTSIKHEEKKFSYFL